MVETASRLHRVGIVRLHRVATENVVRSHRVMVETVSRLRRVGIDRLHRVAMGTTSLYAA